MGGAVDLILDAPLLLGGIPHEQERTGKDVLVVVDRMVLQRVVLCAFAAADHAGFGPVGFIPFAFTEHLGQPFGDLLQMLFIGTCQALTGGICPDAAACRIKDEHRLGDFGSDTGQHPVEQPQRAVIDREIEHDHAEESVSDHGTVDGLARQDIERLPKSDCEHCHQEHGVALPVELGAPDGAYEKDQDDCKEDAVIHHAVDGLPNQRHEPEVELLINHDRFDTKCMMKDRIEKHLDGIQSQDRINQRWFLLSVPDALTVGIREMNKRKHDQIHAEKVCIIADDRPCLNACAHNDEIAQKRRNQRGA